MKTPKRQFASRNCRCPTSKSRSIADSWKTVRRLVARINPKVQEVDLDQVIVSSVAQNLETSGFIAEMRKRIPREFNVHHEGYEEHEV